MATAYIREYATMPQQQGNGIPIPSEPGIADQTVTIGAEADSAALNAKTVFVVVRSDAIYSYVVGTAPTATTSNMRVPADRDVAFGVPQGQGYKISFIANT